MDVRPLGLRTCAAAALSVVLGIAGLGCNKSSNSSSPTTVSTLDLSGTVTFTRAPLSFNSEGVPTGVATDPTLYTTANPARGISLRVFQLRDQVTSDFSVAKVWTVVASAATDSDGAYAITGVIQVGYPTFVELVSSMTQPASPASSINIVGDSQGVYSSRMILDRPYYVLRRGLDGSVISPDLKGVPLSTGKTTLDLKVGISDSWQVVAQRWWLPAVPAEKLVLSNDGVAAGSRILAILDSCYSFNANYGNCVPTSSTSSLELHYRPGLSVKRGTFVEYNSQIFPQSYDGSGYHYFGSVSGGGTVDGVQRSDDAFDTGVLYPILGRNFVYGQRKTNIVPTGVPATSMAPDLVLVEGFGDAMAAILLRSPYLPGSNPANHYANPRDIRVFTSAPVAKDNAFSAPAISALTWELALINAKAATPGNYTAWKTITPLNLLRFFTLRNPVLYDSSGNATTIISDCVSLNTQLARLQETASSSDTSDLATFYTDAVLKPLCLKFGVTWTSKEDAILPRYTTSLGTDPNTATSPLPVIPLSMANAVQIPRYFLDDKGLEQVTSYYPNNSRNEVFYARFPLSLDAAYTLRVSAIPALPEGAFVEVLVDGDVQNVHLFSKTMTEIPRITLMGNPSDLTSPTWHSLRVRMLSPTTLVSDTQVTLQMERTN